MGFAPIETSTSFNGAPALIWSGSVPPIAGPGVAAAHGVCARRRVAVCSASRRRRFPRRHRAVDGWLIIQTGRVRGWSPKKRRERKGEESQVGQESLEVFCRSNSMNDFLRPGFLNSQKPAGMDTNCVQAMTAVGSHHAPIPWPWPHG